MPRWIVVPLLALFVTIVASSIYLRIKHVRASPTNTFWNNGTTYRDLGGSRHVRVKLNRDRLITDLVVFPFALSLVLALFSSLTVPRPGSRTDM